MYLCHWGMLGLDTELVEIHHSASPGNAGKLQANETPL